MRADTALTFDPRARVATKSMARVRERFFTKGDKSGPSGCWLWRAGTNGKAGYGVFFLTHWQKLYAHRVSYVLHFGEIPDSMLVCHHCDVPLCVNPAHLFLGTFGDNISDAYAKGRRSQLDAVRLGHITRKRVSQHEADLLAELGTVPRFIAGESCSEGGAR